MKAKIVSTITIRPEWLEEIKKHIPTIEFDVSRTSTVLQVWHNTRLKSNYGVFSHLRQIVNAPTGYRYRVYVMSERAKQKLGITDHWAAYDNLDRDGVLDFYIFLPRRLDPRATKNGFKSNFAWLFVHEALHGKEQEVGREYLAPVLPDRTHDWEARGDLPALIKEHFLRTRLTNLLKILETLIRRFFQPSLLHPAAGFRITQPYGMPNRRYPLTRHHIGTDYATPLKTPVKAPFDGEVVHVGFSPALGNHLIYQYTYKGQQYQSRFAHLKPVNPELGQARRGDVIAHTGDTGDSTGPHLHWDCWLNQVNLTGISASNFRERTVDPELHVKT